MGVNIFLYIHSFSNQSDFLDRVIFFTAEIFPYLVVLGAVVFLFSHHEKLFRGQLFAGFREKWHEGARAFYTSISAWALAFILKTIFAFPRPFVAIPDVNPVWAANGHAFPSGHSALFMALAVSVFFHHKRIGSIFILSATLIGFARVVAGVHFPEDVLAGFLLGALVAIVVEFAKRRKGV